MALPILVEVELRRRRHHRAQRDSDYDSLERTTRAGHNDRVHRVFLAVYLIVFLGILNEDVRFEIVLSARLEGALQIFAGFDASLYFGERDMFRKDDLVAKVT